MKAVKRVYILPFFLWLLLLLDGYIMSNLHPLLDTASATLVPRLVVIGLVLLTFWVDDPKMLGFAFFAGLLYDGYYSGILGVYMGIFGLIVAIVRSLRGNFRPNPASLGIAVTLFVGVTDCLVFLVYRLLGRLSMDWQVFVATHLAATMLLNIFLYYLAYFPIKSLSKWINAANGPVLVKRNRRV